MGAIGVLAGSLAAVVAMALLEPLGAWGIAAPGWMARRSLYLLLSSISTLPFILLTVAATLVPAALLLERRRLYRLPSIVTVSVAAWLGLALLDPAVPWWFGIGAGAAAGLGFAAGVARARETSLTAPELPGIRGLPSPPLDMTRFRPGFGPEPVRELVWGVATAWALGSATLVVGFFVLAELESTGATALIESIFVAGLIIWATSLALPLIGAGSTLVFVPTHAFTRQLGLLRLPLLVAVGVGATLAAAQFVPEPWSDLRPLAVPLGVAAGFGFWLGTAIAARRIARPAASPEAPLDAPVPGRI